MTDRNWDRLLVAVFVLLGMVIAFALFVAVFIDSDTADESPSISPPAVKRQLPMPTASPTASLGDAIQNLREE